MYIIVNVYTDFAYVLNMFDYSIRIRFLSSVFIYRHTQNLMVKG